MSDYVRCKICDEWGFAGIHKCAPEWECRIKEDDGDDWSTEHGYHADDIAVKYAERCDRNGDYTVARGSSVIVEVRKNASDEIKFFEVTAEMIPDYSADEVSAEDAYA